MTASSGQELVVMALFFVSKKTSYKHRGVRMKVTKDLTELLRRIRLDHEEIIERFRFLDWSAEDAERLGAAAQQMAPA
ncbi:hypothetical protein BTR19_20750 [Pseudomonas fluorescens]|nr:hypothetical protein CFT9_26946 [Pseudomonas sp. CFT9]OKP68374.1 hypothetical protein BTR19_20750 [Pseudomonas fluorescens]